MYQVTPAHPSSASILNLGGTNLSQKTLLTVASNLADKGDYASAFACLIRLGEAGDEEAISSLNSMCEQARHLPKHKVSELADLVKSSASFGPLTAHCLLIDYLGSVEDNLYDAALKVLLPYAEEGNPRALNSLDTLCQEKNDDEKLIAIFAQLSVEGSATAHRLLEIHFNAF